MKHKEQIFKLLRSAAETPQESLAVETMINKIEGKLPPIETISDTKKKFNGMSFYKNKHGKFFGTISLHRYLWSYLNGEIPEGYDIHHKDFNHENNDIDNLQAVTKEEHKQIHLARKSKRRPDKKTPLVCLNCGREYEAVYRGNNSFCSRKCSREFNRNNHLETRICLVCNAEFLADDREDARFCSHECIGKFLSKHEDKVCPVCGKTFSARPNQKCCSSQCAIESLRMRETRKCQHCGKEFSACVNSNQKFCSRECGYASRHKRETKVCPVCGKIFTTTPSRNNKYCCRKCYFSSNNANH